VPNGRLPGGAGGLHPRELEVDDAVARLVAPQRFELGARLERTAGGGERARQLETIAAATARVDLRRAEVVGRLPRPAGGEIDRAARRPLALERFARAARERDEAVHDHERGHEADDGERQQRAPAGHDSV